MKTIDMRFDKAMIQSWIGKRFNMYKCDAFDYTNSVTQIVGLYIGEDFYALTNIQEPVDYFGINEDMSVSKLSKVDDSQVKSAFADVEMISTPVEENINSIVLINENQKMKKNGVYTHEINLTRAIIFKVGDGEISFEKDVVPFSEEIIIQRGYGLIDKCSGNDSFLEDWDDEYEPEYSREVIEIIN